MKDSGDTGDVDAPGSSRSLNSKRVSVVSEDSEPVPPLIPPSAVNRGSNVKQFQGGLVFKAHRLLYHSTLGRE
jgi:hypothetical protein